MGNGSTSKLVTGFNHWGENGSLTFDCLYVTCSIFMGFYVIGHGLVTHASIGRQF